MRVEELALKNFRNIDECRFRPDPQLNFLVGPNGQGKTSIIESLGYLATLRSFRGSKTPEVIRWGTSSSDISCILSSRDENDSTSWKTELKILFEMNDLIAGKASKVASINGKPFRSSTQYLSQRFGQFELGFHTVVFNPSDHDLVRGEPSIRRGYLDRVLAAENVEYLKTLQKYQRVLEQRNAVLKNDKPLPPEVLMGFTEPMARYAATLTLTRLEWVSRLLARLDNIVQQIRPGHPKIRVAYASNWVPEIQNLSFNNNNIEHVHFTGHGALPSLELLERAFWNKISMLETAERRSGHSLVGPHRDDWAFLLGGHVLKGHGSQGEVRSALLGLKLSEIELFRESTKHRPLFLLDDFSSELDRERRTFLLRFLSETDLQVFVTTTEESFFAGKRSWVLNGKLKDDDSNTKSGEHSRVS